jgi:Zn-dependent protease with chaperone function
MFHRVERREIEERERVMKEKEEQRKKDEESSGGIFGEQQEGQDEEDSWLARGGFLKTHPPSEERYRRIVEELRQWGLVGDR